MGLGLGLDFFRVRVRVKINQGQKHREVAKDPDRTHDPQTPQP